MTFAEAMEAASGPEILVLKKTVGNASYNNSTLYNMNGVKGDKISISSLANDKEKTEIPMSLFMKDYNGFHYSQFLLDKRTNKPTMKSSMKTFLKTIKRTCKYIVDYDEKEGKIRGFISYAPYEKSSMSIAELYVSSESRGKGVGTNLMKCIESISSKMGKKFLTLGVEDNNSNAISMYSKYGFKETDEKLV